MSTELTAIDAPPELKESVAACVAWSQENAITTADQYTVTAEHLKVIKASQKSADEFFDPPIKQAHDLHKMLVARKKLIVGPLEQSEQLDKSKMLAFDKEQERIAEEERRRLQAIADEKARKEREKVEQEAARQRAIEAEARAKAEQARRDAEAANAAERKKLLAQAEAAERKAEAALAKADSKAEVAATIAAPVINVAKVMPKVQGMSTRKIWKARVTDPLKVPREYLIVNEKALDQLAKSLKEMAKVPGVEFYTEDSMAASSR